MPKLKTITANNPLQENYQYQLSEPAGQNFDTEFHPELSPKEMLALGVFGGVYLNDCQDEFPSDWFTKARLSKTGEPDAGLNFFGINASQPRSVWQQKGWIHPDDPLGWFQWYCRYYQGRRHPDDQRQIKRWKAIVRHIAQIRHNCFEGAWDCRRKQRQALLHWAYDSRKY